MRIEAKILDRCRPIAFLWLCLLHYVVCILIVIAINFKKISTIYIIFTVVIILLISLLQKMLLTDTSVTKILVLELALLVALVLLLLILTLVPELMQNETALS
jgi:hypothetical protein